MKLSSMTFVYQGISRISFSVEDLIYMINQLDPEIPHQEGAIQVFEGMKDVLIKNEKDY